MTLPRRAPLTLEQWRREHLTGLPHKALRDPDVRAFVDERLGSSTFVALEAACRALFGQERAPSKSALQRYYAAFYRPRRVRLSTRSSK